MANEVYFMRKTALVCIHCFTVLFVALVTFSARAAKQKLNTENVILITTNGLRWQEVFSGADPD